MPASPSLDPATKDRIEKARKEALRLLNGDFSPEGGTVNERVVLQTQSTSSPPPPTPSFSSPQHHMYHTTTRTGRDNVEHSSDVPPTNPKGRSNIGRHPTELQEDKDYTPGKIYQATVDAETTSEEHFAYPSYRKASSATPKSQSRNRPAFRPASVRVTVPEPPSLSTSHPTNLIHSLNLSPSSYSPRTSASPKSPSPNKDSTPSSFTPDEIYQLIGTLATREGHLKLKRLVSPSIKKVKESLVQLLTRVISRGESLGDANKALARSFEVFAGRRQTTTSCIAFSNKLSSLSVSWSSFTYDECLALAMSISSHNSMSEGSITLEDFKRFALENTDDSEQIQRGRSISNFADTKEMDDDYLDDDFKNIFTSSNPMETSLVSNLAKTNNATLPPKSFLEEKFQHLCKKARLSQGINVWGWLDRIAEYAQSSGCSNQDETLDLMNSFILKMNGGSDLDVPSPPAQGSNSPRADPASDQMMKQIAKDCTRLKKELAKKQAQVNQLKSAVKRAPSTSSAPSYPPFTPASQAAHAKRKPSKHIPGTAKYSFSRTPKLNPEPPPPPPPPPSASEPVSIKKQFLQNTKLQRTSTHVMFAAMGLPEESDRFDTPLSSLSLSVSDASVYMYNKPPLSISSNPNENTPKSSLNPRHLSFSNSVFRPKNRSKLAAYHLNQSAQSSKPKIYAKLGYTRPPKSTNVSLNIFKSSRCSTKSLRKESEKTTGKNTFDGTRWKSSKSVTTAATCLFKSRFTDNSTQAWGKQVFQCFD